MAQSSEGTKAIALGLCREFEDKFLEHIAGGEVSEYKCTPSWPTSLRFIHDLKFYFCQK
jgi:dynamin 1/3